MSRDALLKYNSKFLYEAYPYIITTVFLALSILLIYRHELWRDEMISWHFGSETASFSEFIKTVSINGNNTYAWFAILYFISHFITQNPESMKIIHLAISTISIFLILKYAPFNKTIKAMIVFGYFFFYEYSIISRNYALGVLCIVIFCILYKNKYKNILPIAIVLFFIGQGSILSFIISIALFLMLAIEFIIDRKYTSKNIKKIYVILAVLIVVCEILFVYWQISSQIAITSTQGQDFIIFNRNIEENLNSAVHVSMGVLDAYIPLPQFILNFWDRNRLVSDFMSNYKPLYTYLFSAILLIIPVFIIKRRVIITYIAGSVLIMFIPFFIFRSAIRHFGHLFLLFIFCIWLSKINKNDKYLINFKGKANKIFQTTFLTIILIPSLIGSSVAFYYDWKYPFSNAKYVAEYIEENLDKDNMAIVGYQDYAAETVAGYLDKDIYYPNSKNFKKLVDWHNRVEIVSTKETFSDAYYFAMNDNNVLVVLNYDATKEGIPDEFLFKKIDTEFTNAIVYFENYYLYLFDKEILTKDYLSDLVHKINKSNFEGYFRPMNQCEFLIKEEGVKIIAFGDDPWFETTFPFEFNNCNSILAFFNIDSSVEGEFRIFFKRPGRDCIIEDSTGFKVNKGSNLIYIKIPYSEDLEGLRIDPINAKSNCLIKEVKFYRLKID